MHADRQKRALNSNEIHIRRCVTSTETHIFAAFNHNIELENYWHKDIVSMLLNGN